MSGSGRHRRWPSSRRRTIFLAPPPSLLQRLRVALAILAVVVGLAVLAAWFGPRLLDWDQYRSTVEAVASAGLGRPVRIAGPIRLSLLPQATLVAGDVSLADTGDGASADASQLRLRVALGALLAGRIEPQDIVLRSPHMRLPWPLKALVAGGLAPPAGLHARAEDGTLAIGGLQVTSIQGELRVDPTTGALSAAGIATAMGRPWQMTGRLGQAGADGSATLELSLDGQNTAVGTGGTLSGQIAADGGLAGRISARGPDLSLLLPAPARPWQADGQIRAGSGLVVADDLELQIGGSPARGAVAVRLLPHPRLDAAVATSRLDLGAWLTPLLQGGHTTIPTGIELSADAAQLGGGVLRHLKTGFEVGPDGVTLREAMAELPGNAALTLSGQLAAGRFSGEARIMAPDIPQTLAWLRPAAPAVVDALPAGAWQTANLSAAITMDANTVTLANLTGDADGAGLSGEASLRLMTARPVVSINLRLTKPVLDRWLPNLPYSLGDAADRLTALPRRWAGFDADMRITATTPVWRGVALDQFVLDASCKGGVLELRRAALTGTEVSLALAGTLSAAGRLADGRMDLSLGRAEMLGDSLPPGWAPARDLFHGPVTLGLTVSGAPGALAIGGAAEMSDARAQVNGTLDMAGRHWKGAVSLHHPGAPRLLYSLGFGDAMGWLGDGSLSFQATADAAPDHLSLAGVEVSAGSLRASGDLAITGLDAGRRTITGKIEADTLPLPPIGPRSSDPWALDVLRSVDAKLGLRAAHLLLGTTPVADDAAATLIVADGGVRLDGFGARMAGGMVAAQAALDGSSPPHVSLSGKVTGIVLDGPAVGSPVDLVAGRLDGSADLSGAGYSPAGVLATLAGPVRLTVRDGALTGLDAGRVLTVLRVATTPEDGAASARPGAAAAQSEVAEALRSGGTPFTKIEMEGALSRGTLTLDRGEVTMPSGSIAATGSVDLPGDAIDARLALRPALETAPVIGLRLIGPVASPSRTLELADLARWLAER